MSRSLRLSSQVTNLFRNALIKNSPTLELCGQRESRQGRSFWQLLTGAIIVSAATFQEAHQESKSSGEEAEHPDKKPEWHLLDPATRKKTFYTYERRIREFSQPDKVFHYFASRSLPDGTRVMSTEDLIKAVVAVFPPENSDSTRSGSLAGEPSKPSSIKRQRRLIASEGDVKTVFSMFDLNDDGSVNLREFEEITAALQARLKRASHTQRTGARLSQKDSSVGLKRRFFGIEGKDSISLDSFSKFIEGMHEELLRLEYEHYDVDADDTITGRDFAHSMLSCVDLAKVDTYLDRAAKLPSNLASVKVTYQEFRHFARLYQHVHSLAVALNFYHNIKGELERSDFKRATKIVTGSEIADELVEIVYHLFDLNDDGNLSATELVAVLEKREANTFMSANGDEKQTLFSCLYACAFDR